MPFARVLAVSAATAAMLGPCATGPSAGPMSFFITSVGSGKGG